jgi:NTE family protein
MDEALSRPVAQREKRALPFERVALVLQGGGALGAYQAGVYEAIAEANIELDGIWAISIGSINAALIVGNPPEKRIDRLREFWEMVTEPPAAVPGLPWLSDLPWGNADRARTWTNKMSSVATMLYGAHNFFSPRLLPPLNVAADSPDDVSYYDTAPLRETLQKLVDFDLINSSRPRIRVGATNVRTGAPIYFDSERQKVNVDYIMASASLPPGFPPTEIDGEYYWDGGVVSNSAVQVVIDSKPRYKGLAFQVDLWDPNGEVPLDITAAVLRTMEIHSASRINYSLEEYRRMQHMRQALAKLLAKVPESYRNDPEIEMLFEEATPQFGVLVRLTYQAKQYEGAGKIFDFSRRAMEERWQAGYDDTRTALREPGVLELPGPSRAVRIFDAHYGWLD